uniref:fimbrial protein n=1 Tax=Segatella hominis TaxID=2518605 RepID=UPI004025B6F8
MFKMKTITISLLALLLVMSFASCASDTTSDLPLPSKDMKAYLQVKVTVEGSGDTRASRATTGPKGGEDGDGREPGIYKENDVNSLTVLLYKSDNDDLSDDNAIIDYVYTFTNLTKATTSTSGIDATYTTVPKEIDAAIVDKNYHVIVIANADDMTSRCKGKKISEIRDLQMSKVCTRDADITKFSNFIMSSKKDATIDFTTEGSETNPYLVDVDIERLAARIDIIPNAAFDGTSQGYYYNVMDGTNVIGGFKLESVTPTKVMTKGEYLIKRVSSDAAVSAVTYFGEEKMDATTKASTNYVVCPWTKDRAGLTLSNAEGPASLYNVKKTTSTSTAVEEASYILDYVMENTTTDNAEDYSTGLIFKGKYYEETEWDATMKQPKAGSIGNDKEYTYTLRHSDPSGSGTTTDPMHFGVVRNNIYQVKVEGVEGKSKGIKLTIHVVPWAHYDHGEVIY